MATYDEMHIMRIRELLKDSTKEIDVIKDITEGKEFYSVQVPFDGGVMMSVYFWGFKTARNYFTIAEYGRKAFFEHHPDGTRKLLNREELQHKSFDYAAPIKDIYSVPCGKLTVTGNEAFAHFVDQVYCYKYNENRNMWKLVDIKKGA